MLFFVLIMFVYGFRTTGFLFLNPFKALNLRIFYGIQFFSFKFIHFFFQPYNFWGWSSLTLFQSSNISHRGKWDWIVLDTVELQSLCCWILAVSDSTLNLFCLPIAPRIFISLNMKSNLSPLWFNWNVFPCNIIVLSFHSFVNALAIDFLMDLLLIFSFYISSCSCLIQCKWASTFMFVIVDNICWGEDHQIRISFRNCSQH